MSVEQPEHLIGILASGTGSNFEAIDDAICSGEFEGARIAVVLSDKENAGALQIAQRRDIPAYYLGDVDNDARNDKIADAFQAHRVEVGVGAGYLKSVGTAVLRLYPDSILNIHPAPLPEFGGKGMHGLRVHQEVIDSGVPWSGPTVHLMNERYDEGRTLAHVQVPVLRNDTPESLAARILPVEHKLYWRVIAQHIERGRHPEAA